MTRTPPLCFSCETFRFNRLAKDDDWASGYSVKYASQSLQDLLRADTCSLCCLVATNIEKELNTLAQPVQFDRANKSKIRCFIDENDGPYYLPGWSTMRNRQDTATFVMKVTLFVDELECPRLTAVQPLILNVCYTLVHDRESKSLHSVENWDGYTLDLSRIKTELADCERDWNQATNSNLSRESDLPSDFIVIDVQRMCLTQSPKRCRYAALSYVWGRRDLDIEEPLSLSRSNLEHLQGEGAMEHSNLEATITDAIYVCRKLGIRYLWVDRLCIVQDAPEIKHQQISAMGHIYSSAFLTIVAAAGENANSGLPGLPHRPRKPSMSDAIPQRESTYWRDQYNYKSSVNGPVWNSRAWTFQERLLSRNSLIFTETQAFFCNGGIWAEGCSKYIETMHWIKDRILVPGAGTMWGQYERMVGKYTVRHLSYPSDILNAFMGVGNHFSASMKTPFLFALPQNHFIAALLWEPKGPLRRREGTEFPSWSWLAWEGKIQYDIPCNFSYLSSAVNFHVQDSRQGLLPVHCGDICSSEACKATPPPAQPISSQASRRIAGRHPGCLVFETEVISAEIRELGGDDSRPDATLTGIYSPRNDFVGLMYVDKVWLARTRKPKNKHEVIALSGISIPRHLPAEFVPILRSHFPREMVYQLPHMTVILIERKENVAVRVAVGMVVESSWRVAKSVRKTVVLV